MQLGTHVQINNHNMIFKLISENKPTNVCEIHKIQHLGELYNDANWRVSKIDKETLKYICIKCNLQRIYTTVK